MCEPCCLNFTVDRTADVLIAPIHSVDVNKDSINAQVKRKCLKWLEIPLISVYGAEIVI